MDTTALRSLVFNCILSLSTEDGIYASGKNEAYGCIFGRDTAITVLKILKAIQNSSAFTPDERKQLLTISKRALLNLTTLQGQTINIESGEQPGKFIHEYRKDNYDRLLKLEKPWFVYPDGILRNYDSIDATPLGLIALYRYYELTTDTAFLSDILPAIQKGLNWIMEFGDLDHDFLLEYELPQHRKHGGLLVQSWTDSHESLSNHHGQFPLYPIAPVEVQGYAWLSLMLWSHFFASVAAENSEKAAYGQKLARFAKLMKRRFTDTFLFQDKNYTFAAQALDGRKRQIQTITGNPLLLLWASYTDSTNLTQCILKTDYVNHIVERAFERDLFDSEAGIRTMSSFSQTFNPTQSSYHNGSFWPKLNGMAHEGLLAWKFFEQAQRLKEATLKPLAYFQSPIELYIKTSDGYAEFKNEDGQVSCRQQAWSAACALDLLTQ